MIQIFKATFEEVVSEDSFLFKEFEMLVRGNSFLRKDFIMCLQKYRISR